MAVLTEAQKRAVPKKRRGIPSRTGTGSYPMPDRSHAANAKARASQQLAKGNLSSSQAAAINAKANKILGQSYGTRKRRLRRRA